MNAFEHTLALTLGKENYARISSKKVGVAGAGGLGSNCTLFLVRCGFKKFKVIDPDVVEVSNLNRQFYFLAQVGRWKVDALRENLLKINPDLEVETLVSRITEENVNTVFGDCDVVVEALDQAHEKRMLVEAYMHSKKLVVSASGIAGWGGSDSIIIRRMRDNVFLVGDQLSEVAASHPPLAPKVTIAAAKQADLILEYFLVKRKKEHTQ